MGVDDIILALPTSVYIHEDRHQIGCEKLTEHINSLGQSRPRYEIHTAIRPTVIGI